jgi:hypothetical protein
MFQSKANWKKILGKKRPHCVYHTRDKKTTTLLRDAENLGATVVLREHLFCFFFFFFFLRS